MHISNQCVRYLLQPASKQKLLLMKLLRVHTKMFMYFLQIFCNIVLFISAVWCDRYHSFQKYMRAFPEVPLVKLLGFSVIYVSTTELYKQVFRFRKELGRNYWAMIANEPMLIVADPKLIEVILSSSKIIDKSRTYNFFHKWLGLGLLTSSGHRWRKHRKILTAAFHFKILEEFAEIFNSASNVLVDKLKKEVGKECTDIFPYITLCSLDAVCESAMGTSVNAQGNANSIYVRSVKEMCKIVVERTITPIQNFDLTYYFTPNYRREKAALKVLHDFTNCVIDKRKASLANSHTADFIEDEMGRKRRIAFLDLLLSYSNHGDTFSDQDIREEVDTFMFEGHDTTSAALSFALYLLANNPEAQDKAFSEIKSLFSDNKDRIATFRDFQEMKYLELVIKETLRLYPSVPIYSRELKEDLEYEDKILPKGLTLMIVSYVVQRDPDLFKDPDAFVPERFLVNHIQANDGFSYIPFSAGPRNCIGQKFAMLAMKSTLSKVLRNFQLLPVKYELELALESILKSKNGVKVKLKKREW